MDKLSSRPSLFHHFHLSTWPRKHTSCITNAHLNAKTPYIKPVTCLSQHNSPPQENPNTTHKKPKNSQANRANMGERKVLNKYFPPDFDPSLVPRRKRPKNAQVEVRMMLPFSLQCATCGEYMYRGKKFNSRKEEVLEETYHGIRIYRFYIKCVTCSAEITFKTDPKRGDYTAEHGAQRNFEPWREQEDEQAAADLQKDEEEKGDAMKALENRTLDSKREMDILDALDEIKAINQRHARVDTDALLQQNQEKGRKKEVGEEEIKKQMMEDQEIARQAFARAKQQVTASSDVNGKKRQVEGGEKKPVVEKVPSKPLVKPAIAVVIKKKTKKTGTGKKKVAAKPVVASLVADYSDSD